MYLFHSSFCSWVKGSRFLLFGFFFWNFWSKFEDWHLNTLLVKKNANIRTFFLTKKRTTFEHFFEHKNVAIIWLLGKPAAQDTCQEIESEILLKCCEKMFIFRCRKNYRLDLLRCMLEIRKLEKNEFLLFSDKKMMSVFRPKKWHIFVSLFGKKSVTFFNEKCDIMFLLFSLLFEVVPVSP